MGEPILYILDGHSLIFKAYHAIQHLSTSKGVPTNAVYGFLQILHRLLKVHSPHYLVVALDSKGPTFRHEIYPEYKANREAPPEDLEQQIELILQILDAMRVAKLALPGFEADDIIATVATQASSEGLRVRIVSADKDLMQLVDDRVTMLRIDPDKETEFDREGVREKWGVYPEKLRDLLAMVGDTSDNIPGIAKVGPKTAATLLDKYGDLDTVLGSTAELKGKQRENIEAGAESARLSRRLVDLVYDVPLKYTLNSFERQAPDTATLAAIYRELEFRRLADDLAQQPGGAPAASPAAPRATNYRAVITSAEIEKFAEAARRAGVLAFDTETDSLNPISGHVVGISLSFEPNSAIYIPIGHAPDLAGEIVQPALDDIFPILDALFRDHDVRKVGHHMKFDLKMLMKYGFVFEGPWFDTLLASWIMNPDKRGHGLKELSRDLLGITMTPISELIGTGKNQITFDQVPVEQAVPYACADADCTLQLFQVLQHRLHETGMRDLFDQIEMPLVPVLVDMELCGVAIDSPYFASLSKEMAAEEDRIATRIFAIVGKSFNLGSPRQIADVLFTDLGLPPVKKKKTGQSTDVEVLELLAPQHEVPGLILEYRQIQKLKSTYVNVLPGLVESATGRIHTSYNQHIAATGRLSSADPNLQNIPVRTELGRRIRSGFVPLAPGHLLLSADYSQIELRVLAHVSGDHALIEAFRHDRDVHSLTASQVYGVPAEEVTAEMRDYAKVVNFGIIYGMGAHGLSTRLKIPMEEARKFIDGYFAAYSGVKAWLEETIHAARRDGFVTTLAGRRRYLADINSKNFNARSAAERFAVNAPIQGTSADMIKIAMINIRKWLLSSDLRTQMIMQVHDELIFDVPPDELKTVQPRVIQLMQDALPLAVPVKVESSTGTNWAEC